MSRLVSRAVAIANRAVGNLDLKVTVTVHAWTSQDVFGAPSYAAPVSYDVILDERQQQKRDAEGKLVSTRAYIAFLEPITPNGAAGRVEPLDPRDKIVLPDGVTTGPIVATTGFVNKETGRPYFHEVWLGYAGEGNASAERA
jgi:hypothetical protein